MEGGNKVEEGAEYFVVYKGGKFVKCRRANMSSQPVIMDMGGMGMVGDIPCESVGALAHTWDLGQGEGIDREWHHVYNCRTSEDVAAVKKVLGSITSQGGRYTVQLPWKDGYQGKLSNTLGQAYGRLKSFFMRYQGTEIAQRYIEQMQRYEKEGVVENAPVQVKYPDREYVIPHQMVETAGGKKVTRNREEFLEGLKRKYRVVFDASAKGREGVSLNQALYRGSVMLPNVPAILTHARTHVILQTTDIVRAYNQVEIYEGDRDALRYLWLLDPTKGVCKGNVKIMRFKRVPFGIVPGGFLLAMAVQEHLQAVRSSEAHAYTRRVALDITRGLYVDNIFLGSDSRKYARTQYERASEIMEEAHMKLAEWTTNDQQMWDAYRREEKSVKEEETMLGMGWDTRYDVLYIMKPVGVCRRGSYTRRDVLAMLNAVYDPLGMALPVTIPARVVYAKVCEVVKNMDGIIPEGMARDWDKQVDELLQVSKLDLPRWLHTNVYVSDEEIHVFADASGVAVGAVGYLLAPMCRVEKGEAKWPKYGEGPYATTFLMAKATTATHIKTIPRRELFAIDLALRLQRTLREGLWIGLGKVTVWSDSLVALQQIEKGESKEQWVQTRINRIREKGKGVIFRHVSGSDNPADVLSRGATYRGLKGHELWWHGSKYLQTHTPREIRSEYKFFLKHYYCPRPPRYSDARIPGDDTEEEHRERRRPHIVRREDRPRVGVWEAGWSDGSMITRSTSQGFGDSSLASAPSTDKDPEELLQKGMISENEAEQRITSRAEQAFHDLLQKKKEENKTKCMEPVMKGERRGRRGVGGSKTERTSKTEARVINKKEKVAAVATTKILERRRPSQTEQWLRSMKITPGPNGRTWAEMMGDKKWPNDYQRCVRRIAALVWFARWLYLRAYGVYKGESASKALCWKAAERVWIRVGQLEITEREKTGTLFVS